MGTIVTEFADQLFSFMALKYEIVRVRGAAEGGPPIEEYDWPSEEFTIDIARSVMMLSYTYRSAFRKRFRNMTDFICPSSTTAIFYPAVFAKVTYKRHSPLKILVICSFISEMYLYMYFQTDLENASQRYTVPCIECFNSIYKSVLRKVDDPIPKWDDVKRAANLIARGYNVLEPIMDTEHPSQNKLFFNSVQDVLEAAGKIPEQDVPDWNEATNKPPKSMNKTHPLPNSGTKASVSKSNTSAIGDNQSKPLSKKGQNKQSSQSLKINAPVKPNTPQTLPKSGASMGTSESEVSFGSVDQISSRIPGFDELIANSLENLKIKTDKSSEDSNLDTEARSTSSLAKQKSKKHKKRNHKK